ncbi:hypothetical protein pb186bvf_000940 [Paramecium bursaria]
MQGNNIEETPRFCVERDHERFYATLHCIFENCEQKSRWVCASCLFWKIHQHDGRQEATHIVNIQNMQQLQQQAFKKIRHQIDGLITELMNQSQELQQSLINDSFLEFLKSQESFYNQNECFVEIQKLLGIIRQFQNVLKIKFQQFKQDIMSLNQQIMKKKQAHNKIWEQGYCYEEPNIQFEFPEVIVKNQELLKHEDQQLINYQKKWKENTQIIINNNELVRAQYNIIEMFDLENKSRMKKIQSLTKITSLCFNFDNTILFYGDYFGSIYGYSVINKYSLIFKRKLYKCSINQIYSIYDEVITISENNIIKITNFRNRKLIFLHKCQLNNMRIEQFDYDFIKGNLIIQGQDKIQIIDRLNHKLFLDYQQFSKVVDLLDIAFLQPNYIVYLSRELFRKVEINYQKRQLVCCHKFTGKQFEQFLSFSSVDYGNKFIIISEDSVYILNQNLTIFKQIPVKCDKYFHQMYNLRVKQINSMDKIIIIKNGIKFINQDKYDFWLICQEQIIESNKSENNQYFQGNLFNYLDDHQIFIQQIFFWLLNPQIVLYFSHKFGKYDYKSYIQSLSKLSIYFKAVTSNLYYILNAVFFGLTMNLAIVKKINRFSQQWVIYQPILDQIFSLQFIMIQIRIMSQNDKKCTSSSHHTIFQASMICTIEQCDQLSRYLCIICQNEKLHEHNQLDDKHIMNQRTLSNLILSKLFHHLSYQKHLNHCYSHLLRISDFDLSFIKYQENIFCKYQHASKTKKDMIECIINYLESNMNNTSPDFIFLSCFGSELFDHQKYIDRFNNEQSKINNDKQFLEDFLRIIKQWLDEDQFYQQKVEEMQVLLSSNNNSIEHNQLEKLVFLKNKSYNMGKFQQDLKLLLNQQLEKLQNQTREVKLSFNSNIIEDSNMQLQLNNCQQYKFPEDFLNIIGHFINREETDKQKKVQEMLINLENRNDDYIEFDLLENLVYVNNHFYNLSEFQQQLEIFIEQELIQLENQFQGYKKSCLNLMKLIIVRQKILQFKNAPEGEKPTTQDILQVKDIKTINIFQKVKQKVKINIYKFTYDMKYLFCGDEKGQLISFKIKNCKKIYQQKLYQQQIMGLQHINDNEVIAVSKYGQLKIINFQYKKVITTIKTHLRCHNDQCLIEYDKNNNLIYLCQNKFAIICRKGLKDFQVTTNRTIQDIYQMKLVKLNSLLLTVDKIGLKLWKKSYYSSKCFEFQITRQYKIEFQNLVLLKKPK